MEIARSKRGISFSQRKYVLDLLKETGMMGSKPIDTPMDKKTKLEDNKDDQLVDKQRYQQLVGKLIYLAHTRPNIAFPVSRVSQYMHAPLETHMRAINQILRYFKGTSGRGLFFNKDEGTGIEIFTDAEWAGALDDKNQHQGIVHLF